MKITELLVEGRESKENVVQMFKDFFPLAMQVLELEKLPEVHFEPELNTGRQPSFGMYVNGENVLYVALRNRHPVDILRTVAHELAHYRQDLRGELNDQSGETGSPQENQAHELAGIIMRYFNKKYPQYLRSKPL
jgi:hypothetical protein